MGSELSRWAGQVLVLVVLFTVADILMPEGTLRGTVRTVMGVAVVAAVLDPVVHLLDRTASIHWEWERRAQQPVPAPSAPRAGWVDGDALTRSLWEEAVAAAGARLARQVQEALAREGLEVRAVTWRAGEPSASTPLEVVLDGPAPSSLEAARRARRAAASAAGLPEWAVSVRPAPTAAAGPPLEFAGAPAGGGG